MSHLKLPFEPVITVRKYPVEWTLLFILLTTYDKSYLTVLFSYESEPQRAGLFHGDIRIAAHLAHRPSPPSAGWIVRFTEPPESVDFDALPARTVQLLNNRADVLCYRATLPLDRDSLPAGRKDHVELSIRVTIARKNVYLLLLEPELWCKQMNYKAVLFIMFNLDC